MFLQKCLFIVHSICSALSCRRCGPRTNRRCKRDVVHESHKVCAYHQVCIEIDLHSHSACARLNENFPPALQDYVENAIIMYLTTL